MEFYKEKSGVSTPFFPEVHLFLFFSWKFWSHLINFRSFWSLNELCTRWVFPNHTSEFFGAYLPEFLLNSSNFLTILGVFWSSFSVPVPQWLFFCAYSEKFGAVFFFVYINSEVFGAGFLIFLLNLLFYTVFRSFLEFSFCFCPHQHASRCKIGEIWSYFRSFLEFFYWQN